MNVWFRLKKYHNIKISLNKIKENPHEVFQWEILRSFYDNPIKGFCVYKEIPISDEFEVFDIYGNSDFTLEEFYKILYCLNGLSGTEKYILTEKIYRMIEDKRKDMCERKESY